MRDDNPTQPEYCDECGWPIGAVCIICGTLIADQEPFGLGQIFSHASNDETGQDGIVMHDVAMHTSCEDEYLRRVHGSEWRHTERMYWGPQPGEEPGPLDFIGHPSHN